MSARPLARPAGFTTLVTGAAGQRCASGRAAFVLLLSRAGGLCARSPAEAPIHFLFTKTPPDAARLYRVAGRAILHRLRAPMERLRLLLLLGRRRRRTCYRLAGPSLVELGQGGPSRAGPAACAASGAWRAIG